MAEADPQAAAECRIDVDASAGHVPATSSSLRLADHTTLRVGGPSRRLVVATSEQQVIDTVADCDERGEPVLVLGGGSNLLVGEDGFDGTVVQVAVGGITAVVSDCAGADVRVGAGQDWDAFVAHAVEHEFVGIEALSGIPGLVGATPLQNVGAYGAEVSQTISSVRTWDRQERRVSTFAAAECGFGYRTSRFKAEPGRWVVVQVAFQFRQGSLGAPVVYPELARTLDVEVGHRAPLAAVRDAVLAIRRRKGMVLDDVDRDTWSAGSFFMNPLLTPEQAEALPPEAPRYPTGERIKTSAAWLIQHAGFAPGHGTAAASLSTKHVLALTNRGTATADDIVALAREVRDGVRAAWGITLVPEVNLVGVTLD